MNRYRVYYKKTMSGVKFIKADRVRATSDSYMFQLGKAPESKTVAIIPKDNVVSIDVVDEHETELQHHMTN